MSTFAGVPQPVEIYHRGTWYTGELLGWRHDSDGRCLARVRCVVGRLRHSAWKDLADLRLPEPAPEPAPSPGAVPRPGGRRPGDWTADLDDETRPHVLLTGARARPRPPAHSVVPPRQRPAPMPAGASEVLAPA